MKTLLAILCPPLAVLLTGRPLSAVLTLALTLLFWIPGMLHAMLIVSQDFKAEQSGGDGLHRAKQESPMAAVLALCGLLAVLACGVFFWPELKAQFIASAHVSEELPPHDYKQR